MLAIAGTEDATETLHVLPHRPGPGQHDGDLGSGQVDALVENPARHEHRQGAVLECGEVGPALLDVRLMGDAGDQEFPTHPVDRGIVMGEDDGATPPLLLQQGAKQVDLLVGAMLDPAGGKPRRPGLRLRAA